jgi:hypothetical protein
MRPSIFLVAEGVTPGGLPETTVALAAAKRSKAQKNWILVMDKHVTTRLEMLVDRRDVLRGAAGLAAATLGAALSGSVAHASAATFPISIDATPLVYRHFVIPGVTSGWVDSRTVQTFNLAPGQYSFQIASGYYADFTFSVTSTGTVDYSTSFSSFLSGKGTSTLRINGLVVTLDARYLSGSGVLLVAPLTSDDWISYKTVRMVPASHYSVQQGSGEVTSFAFKLGIDGNWSYNATYDVSAGGFLAGSGTSTLTFFGYPLLVDARAAGGSGVTIQPIWGESFSTTSVEYACLLPAPSFALQVRSGVVSAATFSLSTTGAFAISPSATSLIALDQFNGLTRLRAITPL